MKKGLLFALALSVGTFAFGQSVLKMDYKQDRGPKNAQEAYDMQSMDVAGPVNFHKATKGVVSATTIGYSNNVYTMLVEQQTCLTVNEDIGVIQFFHRAKVGDHGAVSSGDMMSTRSTDGGLTWNTQMVMNNSSGHNLRYPSGVIYNPSGNTNPNNAYTAYCGPVSDGAGWSETFMGSMKLDSTNVSNSLIPSYGGLIRMGVQSTTTGKVHAMGSAYSSSPVYSLDTNYLLTGTFNTTNNNFDWTLTKFKPSFVADTDGSDFAYVWHFNTAWSNDGTIGYYWTVGRDSSNDTRAYMPIVWKTVNGGTSWSKMPVFDFSTLSVITDMLQPMKGVTPATSRPMFSSSLDGVVDANGDLHLMALVKAASSNNDDSLGYSYYVANGDFLNPIFDVYTTSTGWDARHLGDIYTIAVPGAEGGYGSIGWDLRLQAGKTYDGTKVFASWTDSDTSIAPIGSAGLLLNMFPDIYVAGWDVISGKQTAATNFTSGTAIYGDCFFQYMSDIIMADNGTYTIPMTEIDKDVDPINPITHNYVSGITFTDADFVVNPGFKTTVDNIASVSQNRPNPFNGNTQIDVNLTKSTNMSIAVINITGQKVYEMNYGTQSAGTHTISINSDNLASGIYFYTVYAGNSSVTKKMIVR
jgi:hypothetical protein